jgi:hypothetical protein
MEPDTERLLMLEMFDGKECRGGRVELAVRVGTWALAMLLAANVSISAIARVVVGGCYAIGRVDAFRQAGLSSASGQHCVCFFLVMSLLLHQSDGLFCTQSPGFT